MRVVLQVSGYLMSQISRCVTSESEFGFRCQPREAYTLGTEGRTHDDRLSAAFLAKCLPCRVTSLFQPFEEASETPPKARGLCITAAHRLPSRLFIHRRVR